MKSMSDVTELIAQARAGDRPALDRLFELLYPELRRLAHARLSRHDRSGDLGTTALVNECYVKFASAERLNATDRPHFHAYCAAAMRSIIVDMARASHAERRGGGVDALPLDTDVGDGQPVDDREILAVHDALGDLQRIDARLAQVVEMRYFGGMSEADIGKSLGVTERTVRRDWQKARLLLAAALKS